MSADSHVVIQNIFYMLAYAYRSLDITQRQDLGAEPFDNALDLLGALYSKGLAAQLRRGLDQGYVEQTDDLPCARGRIDVRASQDGHHRTRLQMRCTFSEMSHDTELNRLVKCAGLMFLGSDGLRRQTKDTIRRLMPYLAGVTPIRPSSARRIEPRLTRSNSSYQLLVAVCHFALNALLPDKSTQGYAFSNVLDAQRLNQLYEKFVLEYYRRHHAKVVSCGADRIPWDTSDELPVFLPGMNTDVSLHGKGDKAGRKLIIDAKCYSRILTDYRGKAMVSPANVYQVFAYVKNADTAHDGSVGGMLLYALTDEDDLSFAHGQRSWTAGGNRFEVRTLDLGQPFARIAAQLDDVLEAL